MVPAVTDRRATIKRIVRWIRRARHQIPLLDEKSCASRSQPKITFKLRKIAENYLVLYYGGTMDNSAELKILEEVARRLYEYRRDRLELKILISKDTRHTSPVSQSG